jgi:hypothetical protein
LSAFVARAPYVVSLEPLDGGRTRVTIDLTYRPTNLVGRFQLPLVRLVASRIQRPMLRQPVQLAHCRIETVRPVEEIAGMFPDFG